MPEFYNALKLQQLVTYLVLAVVLGVYNIYVRRKKHEIKLPTGVFICYLLSMAAMIVAEALNATSAVMPLRIISTIFMTLAVIRIVMFLIVDVFLRFVKSQPVPSISRDISLVVLYIIAIFAVLRFEANVDLASIITTSAVLTAVIGLALQDTLGNLFSGIVLQMEKPYGIGDWVSFDKYTGQVVGMTWKSTRIITREKDIVCIPNNIIAKSQILNYSHPNPTHIATFEIGVSYNDPPNSVREVILSALAEHPSVHKSPEPEVRVIRYNDFSIDYLIRFYISDFEYEEKIKSLILNQLWYRFRREGLTIPFPVRAIQQLNIDPEKEAAKKMSAVRAASASLRMVEILGPLSDDELAKLANRVRFEDFSAGEIIIKEGAKGDSMYAIVSGECNIVIGEGGRDGHVVATLKDGQFFGEMSLLTGEPRSATVAANTDMLCIEIKKEDMTDIIAGNPAVASAISEIVAARKIDLESKRDDIRESQKKPSGNLAAQILSKIKAFFGVE